ncbi:hypothetical protein C1645_831991, partial [Glomus cerebriforme]
PSFNIKVPQLIVDIFKQCVDAIPSKRPTADHLREIFVQWCYDIEDNKDSEIYKQSIYTKSIEPIDFTNINPQDFCKQNAESNTTHESLDQKSTFWKSFSMKQPIFIALSKNIRTRNDDEIVNIFYNEYVDWRKGPLLNSVKEVLPKPSMFNTQTTWKLDSEFNNRKREIEIREINRICSEIKNKYPEGGTFNTPYNKDLGKTLYQISRETEAIRSTQLRITIYETRISQEDSLELEKDESFIPTPLLQSLGRNPGVSFEIDPETYDLMLQYITI